MGEIGTLRQMKTSKALLSWLVVLLAVGALLVLVHFVHSRTFRPEKSINAGIFSGSFGTIAVLPDGHAVLGCKLQDYSVAEPKVTLCVVDLKSGDITNLDAGMGHGGIVAVSPDGSTLAVRHGESELQIWDLLERAVRRTVPVCKCDHLAFSANGRFVYAAEHYGNGSVYRVDVTSGAVEQVFGLASQTEASHRLRAGGGTINSLFVLNGGNDLFVGMPVGAEVWDLAAGRERLFIAADEAAVAFAVNPEETQVAMARAGGAALIDLRTGERLEQLATPPCTPEMPCRMPHQLMFSSDGALLIGNIDGGLDMPGFIVVWRVGDLRNPAVFRCYDSHVRAIAPIPQTHSLLTEAGRNGTICVWDLDKLFNKK